MTSTEAKARLARELSLILCNHFDSRIFDLNLLHDVQPEDVFVNLHLFERLGAALELVRALRAYKSETRTVVIRDA